MAWTIEYRPLAIKNLRKLDRQAQMEILEYIENRIAASKDPRAFGKPLRHDRFGLWRYRVRDYRIICQILDKRVVVLVTAIGHRSEIYD